MADQDGNAQTPPPSASAPAAPSPAGADALKAAQAAIAAAKAAQGTPGTPSAGSAPADDTGSHQIMGEGNPATIGDKQPTTFAVPSLVPPGLDKAPEGIDLLSDVSLNVMIELGRTRMLVEDVLRLGEGSVVELDKLAGDPVDVYVNDRPVARGEVLVLNENFCVRINEILAPPGTEAA